MKGTHEADWSLQELSDEVARRLAGFSHGAADGRVSARPDPRTVRYYTSLGLVDRPRTQGRRARYGRRQLLQLVAVKVLQSRRLPLAEIQGRLYGMTDAELEALVASTDPPRSEAHVREVRMREVLLEPGLRLQAEGTWTPASSRAALVARFEAALTALGVPELPADSRRSEEEAPSQRDAPGGAQGEGDRK